MSIEKNYFVIAGYNLSNYKTESFDDWKWSEDGEWHLSYQRKGRIQLFDDPMSGEHLYFGYILGKGDQYEFRTVEFSPVDLENVKGEVDQELRYLMEAGAIRWPYNGENLNFRVFVFEECY